MSRSWITILFVAIAVLPFPSLGKSPVDRTDSNVPIEITFTAEKFHPDAFNTVQVDVRFTDPNGATKLVPAFWDGGNIWKVRYASPTLGKHRWKSECNDVSDSGLNGISGTVEVARYRGTNPLFRHGPIEVAPDQRHFQHADGTPFFWLGDTWWMGLTHRLHFPDEFKKLSDDRKQKGFNVIQLVAGLYPDMPPFDPRGANEAGFPWTTNYTSIRPQYFDAADRRIRFLMDEGFTPCIVGAWGYFLPWMGVEKAKQHWRELIARYGAWPVVWCVAGEANLPWYLAKDFPYDDREQVHGWTEVARYIRATDPFHRLTTIHPTGIGKLNARWAIDDASLIDFDMLQTPHGQSDAILPTLNAFNHAYQLEPKMPVLNGEPAYEMLNNQIVAQWPRAMFWLCMINGASGHTYGANGIWQVNRRDQSHGASPHGANYGTIPWDEAMHLPGSQQIGDAKKFLEKFPWQKCVPMNDSVSWVTESSPNFGNWIWFPEGDPRIDAPVEKRFFRRTFDLPKDKINHATLRVAADDHATVWVNGKKVGDKAGWETPHEWDIANFLQAGRNVIAIEAENLPATVKLNPAALMAIIEINSAEGKTVIVTDEQWKSAREADKNWHEFSFDDSGWQTAKVVSAYGGGPWGKIGDSNLFVPPFALGIGNDLRIIYALLPQPLVVKSLRPKTRYQLTHFNPVTGEIAKEIRITTNEAGELQLPAPTPDHDWVIVLQKR